MSATTVLLYTTLVVQAAGALLTAGVLFSFHIHYRKHFLLDWTRSWIALAVMLITGTAGLLFVSGDPLAHPYRIAASVIATVAGYMHVGWLLLGTHHLAHSRGVSRRTGRRILAGLVLAGVIAALAFVWIPGAGEYRFFTRIGIRSLVSGVAFVIAATGLRHAQRGGTAGGLGYRLLAVAFVAYAVSQFHLFVVAGILVATGTLVSYAPFLGLVDFLLQFTMSLGMVIWLLEGERTATIDAAEQFHHLAYHDVLTDLPNRQLFLDRLDLAIHHAHREGHQLAVFFLDLDRFKLINDSLGHGVGDRLLRLVGARMKGLLREDDTISRFGGDEFTILTPLMKRDDDAITVARKIRDAIQAPFSVDGHELFITTSIGISMYPADGDEPEALLSAADAAMYRAKGQGRDTFQLYTATMNERALEQLKLENALRKAVANDEFAVYYQPIVDLASGRIVTMETVLRWRHPERGLLRPDDFMELAEASGLIVPIGEWVLRATCAQTRTWHSLGHTGLRAAVNISVRQLQQRDFAQIVSRILEQSGIPAAALELEITESIATGSTDDTVNKLRELKALGVRISIDDFGTGYSSLSALRLFPVDSLKIDQSFVRDLTTDADDAAIATAVIALAHSLRLTVIAEGVETPEQLAFLREHGCDTWQGYLFAMPAPAGQCDELLARAAGMTGVSAPRGIGRVRTGERKKV
ncbi:MAG: putative bifunctional diguanylate cyclase/phosphodiesterase [Gemmatimonadaceae bacterium]